MRMIYIDSDYKCHVSNDGTMTAVETGSFDGKCDAYVEGFRFVPDGESWTRSDGVVFHGETSSAWKPFKELDNAQRTYEKQQLAAYEAALSEIEAALEV